MDSVRYITRGIQIGVGILPNSGGGINSGNTGPLQGGQLIGSQGVVFSNAIPYGAGFPADQAECLQRLEREEPRSADLQYSTILTSSPNLVIPLTAENHDGCSASSNGNLFFLLSFYFLLPSFSCSNRLKGQNMKSYIYYGRFKKKKMVSLER